MVIISPAGGLVSSDSGVTLQTRGIASMAARRIDTLLIAGAEEAALRAVIADRAVCRWIPRHAAKARRIGSVCSGTFVLAALGLIEGRRVATHWEACGALAARYPKLSVDPEALYVVDGKVWTSAGVTTGIDMALAMVEADCCADIANAIARRLVLYARRPGYQSQFSPLLDARIRAESPFADLIQWMQNNLDRPLDVPTLAARANLGERNFYRRFSRSNRKLTGSFCRGVAPRSGAHADRRRTAAQGRRSESGPDADPPQQRVRTPLRRRTPAVPRHARNDEAGVLILLIDRVADHRGEFAHQPIGHLAGHRQLALALEFRIAAWVSEPTVPVGFNWP